jgi:hypothetical protein
MGKDMRKEQLSDPRRGRLVGAILPKEYIMLAEEAEEICRRGGKVIISPTGGQIGIKFPEPEDNGFQLATKKAEKS